MDGKAPMVLGGSVGDKHLLQFARLHGKPQEYFLQVPVFPVNTAIGKERNYSEECNRGAVKPIQTIGKDNPLKMAGFRALADDCQRRSLNRDSLIEQVVAGIDNPPLYNLLKGSLATN